MELSMATLNHKLIKQEQSRLHQGPDEVLHRLTLYFRSMGLPEHRAVEVADQIVRTTRRQLTDSKDDLSSAAIDNSMEMVSSWLDKIAVSNQELKSELRLQLAWFLRPVFTQHPEVFLQSDSFKKNLRQIILSAGRPILPPSSPTTMPPQPLGEVPYFWYRFTAYINIVLDKLAGALEKTKRKS
jgi:hypothetical protein